MKEIDTEPGLHICKAIDLLLEHAQTDDCFTTFNGICLAADRSTSKGALLDKYDEAMAEASRKYKQTQETEQRERYQRPMREQIEGLIAELETDAEQLREGIANQPLQWFQGQLMVTELALVRLRAILESKN